MVITSLSSHNSSTLSSRVHSVAWRANFWSFNYVEGHRDEKLDGGFFINCLSPFVFPPWSFFSDIFNFRRFFHCCFIRFCFFHFRSFWRLRWNLRHFFENSLKLSSRLFNLNTPSNRLLLQNAWNSLSILRWNFSYQIIKLWVLRLYQKLANWYC